MSIYIPIHGYDEISGMSKSHYLNQSREVRGEGGKEGRRGSMESLWSMTCAGS